MAVSMAKQYSVFLPNEPGALSKLAKMFLDAGINMIGIASEVRDDSGVVRIAVEEGVDGADVLVRNGFSAGAMFVAVIRSPKISRTVRVLWKTIISLGPVFRRGAAKLSSASC